MPSAYLGGSQSDTCSGKNLRTLEIEVESNGRQIQVFPSFSACTA